MCMQHVPYLHGPIPAVRMTFAHDQVGRAHFSISLLLTEVVQHPDRIERRITEGNRIHDIKQLLSRARALH